MQYVENIAKKKMICDAVGQVFKRLRGDKSQFLIGAEYDISTSLLHSLEKGNKDPQFTTVFKIAQALGVSPTEFVGQVEKELPEGFSLIEE